MRIFFLIMVMNLSIIGCSKGSNPVRFSKIERNVEKTTQKVTMTQAPAIETPTRNYTLLEMYLAEMVTKEFFMSWFFMEIKQFREKVYLIKQEIETKLPLSQHDVDRILILEYAMNEGIKKFNDRNIIYRGKNVIQAGLSSRKPSEDPEEEILSNVYTVKDVQREGMPAKAISDNPDGFINSFIKYGFKIQEVDFLNRNHKKQ